jgi:hypothetical protein
MEGKDFFSRKSKSDFFETPYSMSEQLFENEFNNENENFGKRILEPACGNYAIYKILKKYFSRINCIDIKYGQDFFNYHHRCNYIITNPPFSLWDEFVQKAKQVAIEKFAFLGRLEFLTGISRHENKLYYDPEYPLTKVYYFVRKVNLSFFDKEEEFKKIDNEIKNTRVTSVKMLNLLKKREETKKKIDYPCLREDGKYPTGMYHFAWFIFENLDIMDMHSDDYDRFIHGLYPIIKPINNHKYILRSKS